jgi:hypothetical protein
MAVYSDTQLRSQKTGFNPSTPQHMVREALDVIAEACIDQLVDTQ